MLVLTRKAGESIMIGSRIQVRVEAIDGNTVRLSIEAPREVPVYRREVYDAIREENLRAMHSAREEKIKKTLPGQEPSGSDHSHEPERE